MLGRNPETLKAMIHQPQDRQPVPVKLTMRTVFLLLLFPVSCQLVAGQVSLCLSTTK